MIHLKIKIILLIGLATFSFYFTDQILTFIDNKSPIMKEIKASINKYNVQAVNATIKDNTIIPGCNGKKVNPRSSLMKMEDFGSFNETFLVYDEITPKISIKNNKEKIIIKGNAQKRGVSLVLEPNDNVEAYLLKNNINYDLITNLNSNLTQKREYINTESNEKNYLNLESILKSKKLNNDICLLNYSNIKMCKEKKKYLVSFSIEADNIYNVLNNITSGDIILIKQGFSVDNIRLLIKEISSQDLKILYLSELISEKN